MHANERSDHMQVLFGLAYSTFPISNSIVATINSSHFLTLISCITERFLSATILMSYQQSDIHTNHITKKKSTNN